MSEELPKSAIPLREYAAMAEIIKSATGEATALEGLARFHGVVDQLVREETLTRDYIVAMVNDVRKRLTPATVDRMAAIPELLRARSLVALSISEQQIIWESEGGLRNLPPEAYSGERRRTARDNASWQLHQMLAAGEQFMSTDETAVIKAMRNRLNPAYYPDLLALPVDTLTGWQITGVINNTHPSHRDYLLRHHRVILSNKPGPKTAIFRAALVKRLVSILKDSSQAGKDLITAIFNDFHATNPSVKPITLSQVNHDLNDR
jgi:hypothetical protein